jgi:hypothetical protein
MSTFQSNRPFLKRRSSISSHQITLTFPFNQTSQGLPNGGQTTHYQISYDISLSPADGLTRAQQLFNTCEFDWDLMSSWFTGVNFQYSLPIFVQINNASGGASWNASSNPTVQINPGSGTNVDFVRYLLVMEVTEMFMASQNAGWFSGADEGSKGEGLSRFLSRQFMLANNLQNVRYLGFEVVSSWLNSPRLNYVDNNPDDAKTFSIIGCPTCFIYYLHDQLRYKITDIINAGARTILGGITVSAGTLGNIYTNLTGRNDGWQSFINLVNLHYPVGPTYNPTGDDLFPVPNLNYIEILGPVNQIVSGSTQTGQVGLDNQNAAEVVVSLKSDNPTILIVPAQVTIPPGGVSAQVNIQAAPVIGPVQTINIHATYAGQTVSAAIQILPRPSILQGRVTDTAGNGISGAFVLLQSDTVITPTTGDSLQLSTGGDGSYTSPDIPPHTYQVSAGQDGYVTGEATATIALGVPVTTQNFTLATVLPITINGKVTDGTGSPISGATVGLIPSATSPGGPRTTTDPGGKYSISLTPFDAPNTYPLTAFYPGHTTSSVTLTIPNGATVTHDFLLALLGSLTGVISDANKTPVQPIASATASTGSLSVVSDLSGRYTLTGLNPGMNQISVSAAGFDTSNFSVNIVSGAVTTQNFSLTEGSAVLTGKVVDQDTGEPIAATIDIPLVSSMEMPAGADGVYKISGIPAGQHPVTVSAPLHLTQKTLVQFSDHQTVTMDFTLFSSIRRPPQL